MAEKSGPVKKDAEYWKNVASKLAITLAIVILASGLIGSWMSSEKVALDGYKNSNKGLRTAITNGRETLAKSTKELKEYKKTDKELKDKIAGLEGILEKLTTEVELYDELEECEKKNKELRQKVIDLSFENADLKARLE